MSVGQYYEPVMERHGCSGGLEMFELGEQGKQKKGGIRCGGLWNGHPLEGSLQKTVSSVQKSSTDQAVPGSTIYMCDNDAIIEVNVKLHN